MAYYKLNLFMSVVYMTYLVSDVSALNAEGIANGITANQSDFQYQAAILGRFNSEYENLLRCNGVVIAPDWILSVADCFMETSEMIMNLIYTAIVGSSHLYADPNAIVESIVALYTYNYDQAGAINNIILTKTNNSLPLGDNVIAIGIPTAEESFLGDNGIVSGYGTSKVIVKTDEYDREYYVQTDPDFKLRFATVNIEILSDCKENFPDVMFYYKYCGRTYYNEDKYTGACSNDAGSPLVVGNKVVGLSTDSYENCDDTIYGSMYTDVAGHYEFIYNVINNISMESVVEHITRTGRLNTLVEN